MKIVIKWISGLTFFLVSLAAFATGGLSIVSGILFIVGGLICLPPMLIIIEDKLNTTFSRVAKYVIVICCWTLGVAIMPKKEVAKNEGVSNKDNDKNSSITTETSANKELEKSPDQKLKEQLERELNGETFTKGLQTETYKGTVQAVQMELILFAAWANIIREGEQSLDVENKKLAATLRKKVLALQTSEFPKMRKEYINVAANKLWEENITVTVQGNSNTIVNITGGIFASNKNKKQMQESLSDVLKSFRFKQVRYRWYKGDDEYTYYDMSVPKDSELVEFSK